MRKPIEWSEATDVGGTRTQVKWSMRVIQELNGVDEWATLLARDLNARQINWKPADDVWSVGQCLQHLLISNEIYLPAIARALDGRSPGPVPDTTIGWFGRWFIRTYMAPSSDKKRAKAPRRIAPGSTIDISVVDRFRRSNDDARALVRRASAYDVNRIRFRNPFIPVIHFTVGTGLEIVWRHQRRHLLQAKRIRRADNFPAP